TEVWSGVRGNDMVRPGRNVMLYLDDVPHVEVGVEAAGAFEPIGRVTPSALPAGTALMTRLVGGYDEIGAAHQAIVEACAGRGLGSRAALAALGGLRPSQRGLRRPGGRDLSPGRGSELERRVALPNAVHERGELAGNVGVLELDHVLGVPLTRAREIERADED